MKALKLDGPLEGGTTWVFVYGLRLRPMGLGTYPLEPEQPVVRWDGKEEYGHMYHGFLGYASPLTEKVCRDFELDFFGCHDCEVVAGRHKDGGNDDED